MNYEFYADVFFLTNVYLDFLAVYIVSEILQQKKRLLRYLFCCALSSFAGILLFLQIENYDVYLLCVHFILNPGMTLFCFFPVKKGIYVKAFCLTYFVILLLGGGMEWTYVTIADRSCYEFYAENEKMCSVFTASGLSMVKKAYSYARCMIRETD